MVDVWQDSKWDSVQQLIIIAPRKPEGKLSTTGVTQGNLGLPLPPNSLYLHQTQKTTR